MRFENELLLMRVLLIPIFAMGVCGQPWTGIISPPRAMDWSGVGATIVNRTTQCGATIAAYTGTAATINNAISACTANQFVQLGAGTFTLSTGVMLSKSNVTLRGAGSSTTTLKINGITDVSCHIGDGRALHICTNGGNIGVDSAENTATWSSGYSQGTTSIVLSTVSNLTVGRTIWLDQTDDPSDGYPAAGDVYIHNWGAGDSYARSGRGMVEGHVVTGCGTTVSGAACTSTTVTISPGIIMPTFRSARSPGAWWGNSGSIITGVGLENLTVEVNGTNAIFMINATNCWLKGVRSLYTGTVSSGQYRVNNFINVVNSSVVDSYFYGPQSSSLVSVYGISTHITSGLLFQNNIVHASVNPFVINSPTYGSVFSYNTFDNQSVSPSFSQPSFILHGHASMNLFEGNNGRNFSGDNIHSSHFFTTMFRNHWDGTLRNPSSTEAQAAFALYAVQRFFNLIGNVVGASNWANYVNSQAPPAQCSDCIYMFGWQGTNANAIAATGNDTNVNRTVMRWGNWDNVTSSNDNGSNDSTGTRFVAGEVPSGITNYPNSVPGSQTLPASFYLSSKPVWFGSIAWPAIGPDVSSSNISTNTGGHANKIPSRVCYESLSNDAAYPSSSPRIKSFSNSCYATSIPVPPTSLSGTVAFSGNVLIR